MRKNGSLLFALLAITFIIGTTSCSKEKRTQNKISGKWDIEKSAYKITEGNTVIDEDTIMHNPGDYIEFNKDGSYEAVIDGDSESGTYKIIGDDQIQIDNEDIATIEKLSNSELTLYNQYTEQDWLYENRIYLTK